MSKKLKFLQQVVDIGYRNFEFYEDREKDGDYILCLYRVGGRTTLSSRSGSFEEDEEGNIVIRESILKTLENAVKNGWETKTWCKLDYH